ncbi:hypothetical protein V7128_19760 [Neobacillus vireti]|uniref:hypothetical protein n=1 Tax=Neobacillus vireti TaxID=220686 RepID=UPI003000CDBD
MTKEEVVKLLTLIESVYSTFLIKDETVLLWFQFCLEMDFEKVWENLIDHIRVYPYPPAFADIAKFPFEENDFPPALQEWMKIRSERVDHEHSLPYRFPIPEWLVEYSIRKSI